MTLLEKKIISHRLKKYKSYGFEVLIENNYANHLGFFNDVYVKEGCQIVNRENVLDKSDII